MCAKCALSSVQFNDAARSPRTGMTEDESKAAAQATVDRIHASWAADPSRDPGYTTGMHGRSRTRA